MKSSEPWSVSSWSSGQRHFFQSLLWWPLHRTVSSKDCGQERCQDVLRTIQQVSDFIAKGKSISHIATICITILKKNYFCLQKHLKQCESLWIFFGILCKYTFLSPLNLFPSVLFKNTLQNIFLIKKKWNKHVITCINY